MRRTLIALSIFFAGGVSAQTSPFHYDFGDTKASFAPNPGASSTKFLPRVVGSSKTIKPLVRVRTASDGSGAFNLVSNGASFIKGVGLEVVAGTTTSKLSFYGLEFGTTTVTSFDIQFDESKTGQWIFANGMSDDPEDVFQGNSSIKDTNTELFAGLRWVLSENGELVFYVREDAKWKKAKTQPFAKNVAYHVQIISNNSAQEKVINGINFPSGTYQIAVNGSAINMLYKTGGLAPQTDLNAILFLGYKPKDSSEQPKALLDNLTVENVN